MTRLTLLTLLLETALPPGAMALPGTAEPFTFIILSDTHVGRAGDAGRLREAVQRIRELQPAPKLVVVSGDLTDSLSEAQAVEYKRIISELPMPVFDVPGNHDEGYVPTPARMERFQRWLGKPPQPSLLTVEGRHFVGFDTQLLNIRRPPPGPDDLGFAQLDALERSLVSLPPGPVFLVGHIPTVENYLKSRNRPNWQPAFMRRFREILERHPVTAVIVGHFHRDQLHFIAGVPLLICPAISNKFNYIPSFRAVTHDARGLQFRQTYLGPLGRGRSYFTDLRGLDEGTFRRQVLGMSQRELRYLWLRRYTGATRAPDFLSGSKLAPDQLRQLMLTDPTADVSSAAAEREPAVIPGKRHN